MAEAVLDSSVILAVIWSERGFEAAAEIIERALVSVVNEAEVISVLIQRGDPAGRAFEIVQQLAYKLVDADQTLARRAGALWRDFKPRGLSLGDRFCLALAEREGLPVLTTDQRWADLPIPVEVRLIRQRH